MVALLLNSVALFASQLDGVKSLFSSVLTFSISIAPSDDEPAPEPEPTPVPTQSNQNNGGGAYTPGYISGSSSLSTPQPSNQPANPPTYSKPPLLNEPPKEIPSSEVNNPPLTSLPQTPSTTPEEPTINTTTPPPTQTSSSSPVSEPSIPIQNQNSKSPLSPQKPAAGNGQKTKTSGSNQEAQPPELHEAPAVTQPFTTNKIGKIQQTLLWVEAILTIMLLLATFLILLF